jgi:hypothetical protein
MNTYDFDSLLLLIDSELEGVEPTYADRRGKLLHAARVNIRNFLATRLQSAAHQPAGADRVRIAQMIWQDRDARHGGPWTDRTHETMGGARCLALADEILAALAHQPPLDPEAVARVIDPRPFEQREQLYKFYLEVDESKADAAKYADRAWGVSIDALLAKARTICALAAGEPGVIAAYHSPQPAPALDPVLKAARKALEPWARLVSDPRFGALTSEHRACLETEGGRVRSGFSIPAALRKAKAAVAKIDALAADARQSAEAERVGLRAALRPFASLAVRLKPTIANATNFWLGTKPDRWFTDTGKPLFSASDLRAAERALLPTPPASETEGG